MKRSIMSRSVCALIWGALMAAGCATTPTEQEPDVETDAAVDVGQVDVAAEDTATPDVQLDCPGGPWCGCEGNEDCDAGICLGFLDGKKCTQGCVPDCPTGTTCAEVPIGTDLVQVCVATWGFICEPCTSSSQCEKAVGSHGSACIAYTPEIGAFCGSACNGDEDCPSGYGCRESKSVEGAAKKACVHLKDNLPAECGCDVRATK